MFRDVDHPVNYFQYCFTCVLIDLKGRVKLENPLYYKFLVKPSIGDNIRFFNDEPVYKVQVVTLFSDERNDNRKYRTPENKLYDVFAGELIAVELEPDDIYYKYFPIIK